MLDAPTIVIFPALMAYAAFSDIFTMTISNWISILLVAIFVILSFFLGLPASAIASHLLCGLVTLAITFVLFAFSWIGGGDAKLAAATAVWMGFDLLIDYGLGASLLGGALTLALLQFRKWPIPGWARARAWIVRLHDKDNGVPYGVALAAAGLALYPETQIFLGALSR